MGLVYRAGQFFQALAARPRSQDRALAQAHLPPTLRPLFEAMSPADQAHGLRVLRALLRQGEDHPDLLAAALLHDVGKSRVPLRLWERVVVVLAEALLPGASARWGHGRPQGWRRPFVVAQQHPRWGAEMLAAAGASALLQELVRRHQERLDRPPTGPTEVLLNKLQQADSRN